MRNDLQDVKQALKDRIEDVCRSLLPDGRREGPHWVAHNPQWSDDIRKLPALKVGLVQEKGAWKCFRSGDKGDVIKLIEHCKSTDIKGALQWARDFLGLRSMSLAEREAMRQAGAAKAKREAEMNRRARANKLDKAKELFLMRAGAIDAGSAAELHARKYFASRGCALEDVAHLNRETFRFSQASEWWKGAKWGNRDGHKIRTEEGPRFPAIHTGMRTATGIVTCCHVTFLDPLLPQKAPVEPPKLMYGEALGAVIEVSTGPSGIAFWNEGAPAGPLVLCEGIETALSLAIGIPEARVWAGGSLAGMGGACIELACVSDVTVARDNNHGNPQAQAQLAGALAKLEASAKQIVVMNSHVGDDFNDLIKE